MDRKQYNRVVIESDIKDLIDDWHICPYSDGIEGLFQTLNIATQSYLKYSPLDTRSSVNIVKDLRSHLNEHRNKNLYHFTDKICDAILIKFNGLTEDTLNDFEDYLQECVLQVYSRS